jgi:hypothetical protein
VAKKRNILLQFGKLKTKDEQQKKYGQGGVIFSLFFLFSRVISQFCLSFTFSRLNSSEIIDIGWDFLAWVILRLPYSRFTFERAVPSLGKPLCLAAGYGTLSYI